MIFRADRRLEAVALTIQVTFWQGAADLIFLGGVLALVGYFLWEQGFVIFLSLAMLSRPFILTAWL